jgi:hypothetical protein
MSAWIMWLERAQAEGHTGARPRKRDCRRPADLTREILALSYLSQAEIARAVRCDPRAVRARLGAARGARRGPMESSGSNEERGQQ